MPWRPITKDDLVQIIKQWPLPEIRGFQVFVSVVNADGTYDLRRED